MEPTVGLGAALLIFLGVGVFAAGIAQAFQLVSFYFSSVTYNILILIYLSSNEVFAKVEVFDVNDAIALMAKIFHR